MADINFAALSEPFDPADIEWRVQQSGMKGTKPWTKVLAYVANRAIQNRLDAVCGPENWKNEYKPAPDGGILCGISIRVMDEWVTKWDGAENTDVEAVKGGLSNSMKRAAVQWGIGRYLYKLEATFAEVSADRGDHYFQIKDGGQVTFRGYWNTPTLPTWALPSKGAIKQKPAKEPETPLVVKSSGTEPGGELNRAKVTIAKGLETQGYKTVFTQKEQIRKALGKSTIENLIEANLVAEKYGIKL